MSCFCAVLVLLGREETHQLWQSCKFAIRLWVIRFCFDWLQKCNKKALLSQGEPRDTAVNLDTCRILQWHRAVSPSHSQSSFINGLCQQSAVITSKNESDCIFNGDKYTTFSLNHHCSL